MSVAYSVALVVAANVFSMLFTYFFFIDRTEPFMAKLHSSMLIYGGLHFLIGFIAGTLFASAQRRRSPEDCD